VIVLDTSVTDALLEAADQGHREARDWDATVDRELATTSLILAEADGVGHERRDEHRDGHDVGDHEQHAGRRQLSRCEDGVANPAERAARDERRAGVRVRVRAP
jgi:hypothetical protein